jgi:hypothetical protein
MKLLNPNRLTVIISCIVMLGCSGPKSLTSSPWQSKPIVVDGSADEWEQPLRYMNSDTKLNYSVSNDGQKLYFCFISADRRSQIKTIMGGLQIRVEGSDKGKTTTTLLYPIPGRIKFPARPKDGDNSAQQFDRQQLMMEANSMQVSGFSFAKETTELPLINKYGVNVAATFTTDDRLIYEASIPLQDLQLAGKDVDVTITVKGLPRDQMPKGTGQGGRANGMGSSGGGGMRGPGGMGGGMGAGGYGGQMGGGSSYSTAFVDQKMKMTIHLADKE